MKNRSFKERVVFAAAGWRAAYLREKSFRTQVAVAALAFIVLAVMRPSPIWWALVSVTVALVLALELVNSAIEGLVDLLHPDIHPEVKAIKDMLAGAVLAISTAAVVVAVALTIARAPALFDSL